MRGRLKVAASRRGYHALVNIVRGTRPLGIVSSSAPQVRRARASARERLMGTLLPHRSGTTGGTEHARRTAVAAAPDLQECAAARASTVSTRARGAASAIAVARGSWLTRGRVFRSVRKSLYGNAAHESRNRAVSVSRPTAPCFLAGFALDSWSICRCKALSEGQLILPAEIRQRDRIEPGSCRR
jgi:hypothetical protein